MSEARTWEPTPRRLREARAEGKTWRSPLWVLGAVLLGLRALSEHFAAVVTAQFDMSYRLVLERLYDRPESAAHLLSVAFAHALEALLPLLAMVALLAIAATMLTGGPIWAARASMRSSVGRRSGGTTLGSELRALLSALVIVGVFTMTLWEVLPGLLAFRHPDASRAFSSLGRVLSTLVGRSGVALLGLGVLDALTRRSALLRSLRMTRREVEEEARHAEGEPHAKRERARIRRELATSDLEGDVINAYWVITGVVSGTPGAVALAWKGESDPQAPRVVARGMHELALRIESIRNAAGGTVIRDDRLLEELARVEPPAEIPSSMYSSVRKLVDRVSI